MFLFDDLETDAMIVSQEIKSTRQVERSIIGKKSWGGAISMSHEAAANFELGEVYWLEQKQPDFLRPEFRRRAKVISVERIHDYVSVGFVAVPNPPKWSLAADPESRQLAGLSPRPDGRDD